jgi:pyruvate formate lyase activating enzyme
MDEVLKDRRLYSRSGGGITLTGGEPLMQASFVLAILEACRKEGLHAAMETGGYSKTPQLEKIAKTLDLVLFDIKHMDSREHEKLTGVGNEIILDNARKISRLARAMIIRIPLIPGCNDTFRNLENVVEFAKGLKSVKQIDLMPYHRLGESKYASLARGYSLHGVKSLDKDDPLVLRMRDYVLDEGFQVTVGG